MDKNIVLIGMPGCGKSTVGRLLSEKLHRPFFDSDDFFAEKFGISPADYILKNGEPAFRDKETEILAELCGKDGVIIASGGGAVTRDENYASIHRNSAVVWLHRDTDKLAVSGRPISQTTDVNTLYEKRRPMYERFADVSADNNGTPDEAVTQIVKLLF